MRIRKYCRNYLLTKYLSIQHPQNEIMIITTPARRQNIIKEVLDFARTRGEGDKSGATELRLHIHRTTLFQGTTAVSLLESARLYS